MLRPSRYLHRTPIILFALDLVLVASLFIAPATLEPGTVTDLDARANAMDHWEKWKELGPYHLVVYTFGDINCHQMEERSIMVNGNQMPVCARDVAIFIGFLLGSILLFRAVASDNPAETVVSVMPGKVRKNRFVRKHPGLTVTALLLLMIVPTALDGGIQMLSTMDLLPFGIDYESTNPTRLITGFPMGVAAGILMNMLMMTLLSRREGRDIPLLPIFSGRMKETYPGK
ncbi:MAG: DUF2085 domain-containing protein [Thermoplasmatota archaeon]